MPTSQDNNGFSQLHTSEPLPRKKFDHVREPRPIHALNVACEPAWTLPHPGGFSRPIPCRVTYLVCSCVGVCSPNQTHANAMH